MDVTSESGFPNQHVQVDVSKSADAPLDAVEQRRQTQSSSASNAGTLGTDSTGASDQHNPIALMGRLLEELLSAEQANARQNFATPQSATQHGSQATPSSNGDERESALSQEIDSLLQVLDNIHQHGGPGNAWKSQPELLASADPEASQPSGMPDEASTSEPPPGGAAGWSTQAMATESAAQNLLADG